MSYVICPVASSVPPASSNRMMLKPPGRLVGREHADSAAGIVLAVEREVVLEDEHQVSGGKGVGCDSTVTGAKVLVRRRRRNGAHAAGFDAAR
jgi:hypothetical protein